VNPETTGRFKFWSLQLWGEAVDPSKTRLWSPAAAGEEDEEQVGSEPVEPTTTAQKPKPTNLLPGDHGQAEGEAHKPGLGEPVPNPPGQGGETGEQIGDIGVVDAGADEGYFKGIETLATKTNVIAGAGGFIILAASAIGLFFFLRSRRKRSLFRDLSEGERGAYLPVSDSMQMGLLGGRKDRDGANGGSKDLYDAFAEGDTTDDDEDGRSDHEAAALRYHDSFLDDEDGEDDDREHDRQATGADKSDEERNNKVDDAEEAVTPTSSTSTPRPEAQDRLLSP
jgi:kexin